MYHQREQLQNAHQKVVETHDATVEARQVLKNMAYRAVKNKIVLWIVIIILIAANGAVVWCQLLRKCSKKAPAPTPAP